MRTDRTPDGVPMVNEYIPPYVFGDYDGVRDGNCILHTNYRQDREIQLTMAFVQDDYPGTRARRPKVTYLGFTRYYDELTEYLLPPMSEGGGMNGLLGEVISGRRTAPVAHRGDEEIRHVTSFMNGKATTPYPGEDQVEIKTSWIPRPSPATRRWRPFRHGHAPRAPGEQPLCLHRGELRQRRHGGPTGDFNAAKTAIEVVDTSIGRIVPRLLRLDAHILITADHGNSEQMVDYATGKVKTSHTLLPVEFIYVAKNCPAGSCWRRVSWPTSRRRSSSCWACRCPQR